MYSQSERNSQILDEPAQRCKGIILRFDEIHCLESREVVGKFGYKTITPLRRWRDWSCQISANQMKSLRNYGLDCLGVVLLHALVDFACFTRRK